MRHRIEIEFDAESAQMAEDILADLIDALDEWADVDGYQWQSVGMTPVINDALPPQNVTFPAWLPRIPPTTGTATPA